jgi:ferritin-like metal-binding protein YciE
MACQVVHWCSNQAICVCTKIQWKPNVGIPAENREDHHGEKFMTTLTLRDLYLEELKDLYDAENRLIKALPKMAKAADSAELRQGFEGHLEQTKQHALRLEKIFEQMGEEPKRKKCIAMAGLVQEGDELIAEDYEDAVKDAALISAAQRVEHYEMAAYGCVRTWAGILGDSEAETLLGQTLAEEKETNQKLNKLSETINKEANGNSEPARSRAAGAGRN